MYTRYAWIHTVNWIRYITKLNMSMYRTRRYTHMCKLRISFDCDGTKPWKKWTKNDGETETTPTKENEMNSVHRVCECVYYKWKRRIFEWYIYIHTICRRKIWIAIITIITTITPPPSSPTSQPPMERYKNKMINTKKNSATKTLFFC